MPSSAARIQLHHDQQQQQLALLLNVREELCALRRARLLGAHSSFFTSIMLLTRERRYQIKREKNSRNMDLGCLSSLV